MIGDGVQQRGNRARLPAVQPLQPVQPDIRLTQTRVLNRIAHAAKAVQQTLPRVPVIGFIHVQRSQVRADGHGLPERHARTDSPRERRAVVDGPLRPRAIHDDEGAVAQVRAPEQFGLGPEVRDEYAGRSHVRISRIKVRGTIQKICSQCQGNDESELGSPRPDHRR